MQKWLMVRQESKAKKRRSFSDTKLFFLCHPSYCVIPLSFHPSLRQIVLNINFSSRTTSLDVQRTIEATVEKRTKNIFGPPVGKKLIAFVDDMNMPKVDNYGTQQPIALLKLLVENGGMYDRGKNLNWKIFKDICEFYCSKALGKLLCSFGSLLIVQQPSNFSKYQRKLM
jgi:hypothetical protein